MSIEPTINFENFSPKYNQKSELLVTHDPLNLKIQGKSVRAPTP